MDRHIKSPYIVFQEALWAGLLFVIMVPSIFLMAFVFENLGLIPIFFSAFNEELHSYWRRMLE